ncbi:hypothetical protein Bca4012_031433 [Brassica carinata]
MLLQVLLISKKAGGVGLNMTAASNDSWWTPAIEEEEIMRIHRIQHKRILEGLVKETLKWCREITWNSLLQFMCLKQDCTQMSYCMGLEAMPHSYSMLRYLATFPCGAVPFTAEEERPPDLSCDGAAKKYEYVRV